MTHDWAVNPNKAPRTGWWFVNNQGGYSAFLSSANGRIHLFQDYGNATPVQEDDFGYLLIPNLTDMIELLKGLRQQVGALGSQQIAAGNRKLP